MVNVAEWLKEPVSVEFEGAELGDARRTARLQRVAEKLEGRPAVGFPQVFGEGAELEAFYRLMRNDAVQLASVIEPHLEATAQRGAEFGTCLVIHDTTTFKFGGEQRRQGLGHTASKAQGFLGHFALAVGMDDVPIPLGVMGVETLVRKRSTKGKMRKKTSKNYEFGRWLRMLDDVEERAQDRFDCIHVMDREADFIDLLRRIEQLEARYVIRAARQRRGVSDEDGEYGALRELISEWEPQVTRTAHIHARGGAGQEGRPTSQVELLPSLPGSVPPRPEVPRPLHREVGQEASKELDRRG